MVTDIGFHWVHIHGPRLLYRKSSV